MSPFNTCVLIPFIHMWGVAMSSLPAFLPRLGLGSYFNSTVETTVFAPRGGNAAIDCAVGNLGDSTVREEYSVYT